MEWVEALAPTGLPLFPGDDTKKWDGIIKYCRLLIVQPPAHGKTSFAEELVIWLVTLNRTLTSLFLSKTADSAKDRLYRIQGLLTDEAWYDREGLRNVVREWGPYKPPLRDQRRWSSEEMYVLGSSLHDRDATVEARGVGNQIQGNREDAVIGDDIFTLENQLSQSEREKQMRWFGQTVLSRLPPDGGLGLVLNTRCSPVDNVGRLIESEVFSKVIQPAILDEEKKTVLWPEAWPFDKLEQRRKEVEETAGTAGWLLTYQQQATDLPDAPFKLEFMEEAKVIDPDYAFEKPKGLVTVIGVDPAVKGTCAIVVLGLDLRTKQRVILDCLTETGLGANQRVKNFVYKVCEKYRPVEVKVERNSQQDGTWEDGDFRTRIRELGARLTSEQTQVQKWDPMVGVTVCASRFEAGQYTIPWNAATRPRFQPFLDELAQWRAIMGRRQTQDRVMALWFAELAAMNVEKFGQSAPKRDKVPKFLNNRLPTFLRSA